MKITQENIASVRKILIISLTNIGDVILTFPAIDVVIRLFPQAEIALLIGPKAAPLVEGNPNFNKVYIFDKHQPGPQMLKFTLGLRREGFDCVIDFRHTFIPILLQCPYHTTYLKTKTNPCHMRQRHLERLKGVLAVAVEQKEKYCLANTRDEPLNLSQRLPVLADQKPFIVVAPGAADRRKRWAPDRFSTLCRRLREAWGINIVLIGDEKDKEVAAALQPKGDKAVYNLCGLISLSEAAHLIARSALFIGNDSAPTHLASYLDIPVVALFGPSEQELYGPWNPEISRVLTHRNECPACVDKQEATDHLCMACITEEEVFGACQALMREKLS